MTETDDLIEQLQDRLARRAGEIDAPAGLADHARRSGHRRVARRAAIGGIPSLLAAALAVTLVTTGQSHPGSGVDAAYIAQHVSVQLGQQGAGHGVLYDITTDKGERTVAWDYTNPHSHVEYNYSRSRDRRGRLTNVARDADLIHGQHSDDHMLHSDDHLLVVQPRTRTWYRQSSTSSFHVRQAPGDTTSGAQLARDIKLGDFVREGTTSIGGERVLKLRLKPRPSQKAAWTGVLYVNARTYEPVESFMTMRLTDRHNHSTFTDRRSWLPPTKANRAKATRSLSAPVGYREVLSPARAQAHHIEELIRAQLRTAPPRQRRELRRQLRLVQRDS